MTDPTPGEAPEAGSQANSRLANPWFWIIPAALWVIPAAAVAGGAGLAGCWLGHGHIVLSVDHISRLLVPLMVSCGLLGGLAGCLVGTLLGLVRGSVAGSSLRAALAITAGSAGGAVFGVTGGALTPLLIVALGPTLPPEAGAGLAWALVGALSGWAAWEWQRVRVRERSAEMATAGSRGSEPG